MKFVPHTASLFFVGLIIVPFTLLLVVAASVIVPTIVLAAAVMVVAIMDAYRSQGTAAGYPRPAAGGCSDFKGQTGQF